MLVPISFRSVRAPNETKHFLNTFSQMQEPGLEICLVKTLLFYAIVPLGSIPELPAEACKEIKASEGGHAVSGKYWFDSIVPGEVVLAYCDMESDGQLSNETCRRGIKHVQSNSHDW